MQNFLMDDIDGFSWLAAWARRSNPPLLSHKRFEAKFLASIVHCTVVERALLAWQGTPRICIRRHEHRIRIVLRKICWTKARPSRDSVGDYGQTRSFTGPAGHVGIQQLSQSRIYRDQCKTSAVQSEILQTTKKSKLSKTRKHNNLSAFRSMGISSKENQTTFTHKYPHTHNKEKEVRVRQRDQECEERAKPITERQKSEKFLKRWNRRRYPRRSSPTSPAAVPAPVVVVVLLL